MKEMRKKIQKHQSDLRKKKEEERKNKKELQKNTRKNPFHRKHGDSAEKRRIDSLAHLSDRQKRVKKRNIDAGTPGKSTTTSKKTTRGRKLSPYEMKKEARLQAMRDKARARHKAWKESRKKK